MYWVVIVNDAISYKYFLICIFMYNIQPYFVPVVNCCPSVNE